MNVGRVESAKIGFRIVGRVLPLRRLWETTTSCHNNPGLSDSLQLKYFQKQLLQGNSQLTTALFLVPSKVKPAPRESRQICHKIHGRHRQPCWCCSKLVMKHGFMSFANILKSNWPYYSGPTCTWDFLKSTIQQFNFTLIFTVQGFKLRSHYFKLSGSLDRILCQIQMFYRG